MTSLPSNCRHTTYNTTHIHTCVVGEGRRGVEEEDGGKGGGGEAGGEFERERTSMRFGSFNAENKEGGGGEEEEKKMLTKYLHSVC
jgi:hypothetical protein